MNLSCLTGYDIAYRTQYKKPTIKNLQLDSDDWIKYGMYTWTLSFNPNGTPMGVVRREAGITVHLAREIINCPKDLVVDHRNGDVLDNRKENLRQATTSQNARNLASSGYCWRKARQCWIICVQDDNGQRLPKLHVYNELDAKHAVDACRRKLKDAEYCRYHFPLIGERAMNGQLRTV